MRKLKLPKLIKNSELPEKMTQKEFEEMLEDNWVELVPDFTFDVNGLNLCIELDDNGNSLYLYAYICGKNGEYYDYAIVKTNDIYFRTYAQYKQAIKTLAKQITQRWKEWVDNLYELEL